jgi:hypothetical protein
MTSITPNECIIYKASKMHLYLKRLNGKLVCVECEKPAPEDLTVKVKKGTRA